MKLGGARLRVEAEHGGEAQEGVLLLHVVPDAAQRRAPDADKVLQVRRDGLWAHPGHASQRDCTATSNSCSGAAMDTSGSQTGSLRLHITGDVADAQRLGTWKRPG